MRKKKLIALSKSPVTLSIVAMITAGLLCAPIAIGGSNKQPTITTGPVIPKAEQIPPPAIAPQPSGDTYLAKYSTKKNLSQDIKMKFLKECKEKFCKNQRICDPGTYVTQAWKDHANQRAAAYVTCTNNATITSGFYPSDLYGDGSKKWCNCTGMGCLVGCK